MTADPQPVAVARSSTVAARLSALPGFRTVRGPAALLRRYGWNLGVLAEVLALLALWALFTAALGWANPSVLPSPGRVWEAFVVLASTGTLLEHTAFTAQNFIVGFALATVVGIPVGAVVGSSRLLDMFFAPPMWALYSIPRLALAPLFILSLGMGSSSKIAVVFLMSTFPILINTMQGVKSVPEPLLRAGRVYGASRWQLARKIVLPSLLPYVLIGMRLGVGGGIAGTLVGEFIASFQGLGLLLKRASYNFEIARALTIVIIVVILAQVAMSLLQLVKRLVAPWDQSRWT